MIWLEILNVISDLRHSTGVNARAVREAGLSVMEMLEAEANMRGVKHSSPLDAGMKLGVVTDVQNVSQFFKFAKDGGRLEIGVIFSALSDILENSIGYDYVCEETV